PLDGADWTAGPEVPVPRAVSPARCRSREGGRPPRCRSAEVPLPEGSVRRSQGPAVDLALVSVELVWLEPEAQLAGRRFGAVRGVDEVLGGLESEVAADGAWCGFGRPGRPDHGPNDGDRVRAFQGHRHEWARGDEVDEALEE